VSVNDTIEIRSLVSGEGLVGLFFHSSHSSRSCPQTAWLPIGKFDVFAVHLHPQKILASVGDATRTRGQAPRGLGLGRSAVAAMPPEFF